MTDIDKIGFGVDTGPLNTLNTQLDTTKQSVKGLNEELQKTPAASQTAAASLGQVSTAAQNVKNSGADQAIKGVGDAAAQADTKFVGLGSSIEGTGGKLKSISESAKSASDSVSSLGQKSDEAKGKLQGLVQGGDSVGETYKKVSDAVNNAKDKLAGFGASTDSAKKGAADLQSSIQSLADKTGVSFDAMQRQIQSVATRSGDSFDSVAKKMLGLKDTASVVTPAITGMSGAINESAAGFAKAGTVAQTIEDIVKRTGASYTQAAQGVKEQTEAQTALNNVSQSSGGFFSSIKESLSGFGSSLKGTTASVVEHTGKAREMGSAHRETSESAKMLRETAHTLEPVLDAVGVKFSSVTQFSGATRAGLLALGVSIAGTVLVELQKLADESLTLQTRLEGLAGIKAGDRLAEEFDKVVHGADHLPSALAPALESLIKFQEVHGPENLGLASYTQGFQSLGVGVKEAVGSVQSLFESIRLGGANTEQATTATNRFFAQIQSDGKVTAAAMKALQDASPATAQALTSAFTNGRQSASQFIEQLKQQPAAVNSVIRALQQMKSANDTAYRAMIQNPQTVEDALEKLKNKFKDVGETIKDKMSLPKEQAGLVTQAISGIANAVDKINNAFKGFDGAKLQGATQLVKDLGSVVGAVVGPVVSAFETIIGAIGSVAGAFLEAYPMIREAVLGWATSVGDFVTRAAAGFTSMIEAAATFATDFATAIGDGMVQALAAIGQFVVDSLQKLTDWATQAIDLAKGVASAIAGAAAGIAAGGGTGQYDAMGNSTGASEGNIAGFATGGSFVVGGSGGTDSQLIQFMATPGERVTIDQPGNGGGQDQPKTLGSLIPAPADGAGGGGPDVTSDLSSAKFSNALKEQTQAIKDFEQTGDDRIIRSVSDSASQIVAAIKAITPTATPATTSAGTSSGGSSSSSAASAGGGGGGGGLSTKKSEDGEFGTPWSLNDSKAPNDNAAAAAPRTRPNVGSIPYPKFYTDPPFSTWQDTTSSPSSSSDSGGGKGHHPNNYDQRWSNDSGQAAPDPGRNNNSSQINDTPRGAPTNYPVTPVAPKSDDSAVRQQTSQLKQSQDNSGKTISDAVRQQKEATRSIGDKTNSSLSKVSDAAGKTADGMDGVRSASQETGRSIDEGNRAAQESAADQQKSLDSVDEATGKVGESVAEGTDAAKSTNEAVDSGNQQAAQIGDRTDQSLQGVDQSTKQVSDDTRQAGEATRGAVDQSSQTIADATRSGADSIVQAIQSLASSIMDALSSSKGSSGEGEGDGSGSSSGGDSSGSSSSGSSSSESTPSGDTGSGYATGGQFTVRGFASGGQFAVTGKGHADTELVQFMASPGETVTITPPGANPPPNPTFDSHPNNGSKKGYATGGQMTLGGMFGQPSVAKNSADLITANIAQMFGEQSSNLGDKIGMTGNSIVQAISGSTSTIMGAVSSMASAIPDPTPAQAASSSNQNGAGNSGRTGNVFKDAAAGDGWSQDLVHNYGGAIATGGIFSTGSALALGAGTYEGAREQMRAANFLQYGYGGNFATGGQFRVGGLRGFATGGQITAGNDNGTASEGPGFEPAAPTVGADTLASGLGSRMQQATAGVKGKLDTLSSQITSSISAHTNAIVSGVDNIRARFDAFRSGTPIASAAAAATSPAASSPIASNNFFSQVAAARPSAGVAPTRGLADGGAFVVPGGQSGTDSVDVAIKAAPGEHIFVVPADKAKQFEASHNTLRVNPQPLSDFMAQDVTPTPVPGNSSSPIATGGFARPMAGEPVAASGGGSSGSSGDQRPITIVVQDKVQADDFIRSRAQIRRAMG